MHINILDSFWKNLQVNAHCHKCSDHSLSSVRMRMCSMSEAHHQVLEKEGTTLRNFLNESILLLIYQLKMVSNNILIKNG